ncbi:MAG: beta-xylosidase [Alphaproteobacteria bacterium]|nr:beta-xylosidase [Alphaproteobacteria bacterium]
MRFSPLLLTTLLATGVLASAAQSATITVDLSRKIGPYKPTYAWFGYDEGNYTTMKDGRVLLRKLRDLSPVSVQVRVHHLFTSGDGVPELKWSSTNVYREDAGGKPIYDFKILDGIFDEFKAAGVTPMVELGFMPKDLTSGTNDYQVHYPARPTSGAVQAPPKDFGKWQELVRVFTDHLVKRYGASTVRGWYFEVWNEPDIDYWHGTPEQYWQLYDHAVAGVRAALPGALVGGPATTGPNNPKAYKFLDDFLTHVSRDKVPMDFISFHVKGLPVISGGDVKMGLAKELKDADKGFEIVARHGMNKLPIILSEADPEGCAACSMKVNPANGYRNGTLYPSYTAAAYKGLLELADRRKVNLISMLSWSFEFENKEYFEGFRSLSTNGIDKPILNFFRMAALMDGSRVGTASEAAISLDAKMADGVAGPSDIDAMATANAREAAILLWNYHDDEKGGSPAPVDISVKGLPKAAGRVKITHYRIDDTHSNAYTAWKAMGSPQNPSAQQLAELKTKEGLQLLESPTWVNAEGGEVRLHTDLPSHAVSLVQLSW